MLLLAGAGAQYDFEYFVSQVGIDTTLKNAWGSQLYQQELCQEFLNYAPSDFVGEARSIDVDDDGGADSSLRDDTLVASNTSNDDPGIAALSTTVTTPVNDVISTYSSWLNMTDSLNHDVGHHEGELRLGNPFAGWKVDYDFNSQRAHRSLVVSGTQVNDTFIVILCMGSQDTCKKLVLTHDSRHSDADTHTHNHRTGHDRRQKRG